MQTRTVLCLGPHGFHTLAYHLWGDPQADRVLVCAHGLTRTGRDFDALASHLAEFYRVACPDFPGRGGSEWLVHPEDYAYPLYLSDMAALLAHLDTRQVDWVGTSMGGLVGMMLAAQPGTPIRHLVLNDVGPLIPKEALARIAAYVGMAPRFATLAEAEAHLRQVHEPFGPLTDAQWHNLSVHSVRQLDDGSYTLHYDPGIAVPVREAPLEDISLWPVWEAVACPVLVLRGQDSDILPRAVAEEMLHRGPPCQLVEFPGIGHAPALLADDQIETVRDWLLRTP